ncbi:MAG: DUF411 domain-containing protein [Pikeienuella sp.]|uniref:DUF411 domain-containing protein n=1 Tax=Pikeienuella sp. TaxID=2831957 RepID=UPI00391C3B35
MPVLTRRTLLVGAASFAALAPRLSAAQGAPTIHIRKTSTCACCTAWGRVLEGDGFVVAFENLAAGLLVRHKLDNGIPEAMISCHTGEIDGYFIEGHVPPADIRRLLSERPDAVGLAVPGMPYGSPGMGPEDRREAYDVFLIRHDGGAEVFTSYEAAA